MFLAILSIGNSKSIFPYNVNLFAIIFLGCTILIFFWMVSMLCLPRIIKANASQGATIYHRLSFHKDYVRNAVWSPDGDKIASCSRDNTIIIWSSVTANPIFVLTGHTDFVNNIAWSPNGSMLASASSDCTARVWDVQTGEEIQHMSHGTYVHDVAWFSDGSSLASISGENIVIIWNANLRCFLKGTYINHPIIDPTNFMKMSPDREVLAIYYQEAFKGNVQLLNLASNEEGPFFIGTNQDIGFTRIEKINLVWSPDGKKFACNRDNISITIFDVYTLHNHYYAVATVSLTGNIDIIKCIAWNTDGNYLAAGYADGSIYVWKVQGEKNLFRLEGHTGAIRHLSFSSDGRFMASIAEVKSLLGAFSTSSVGTCYLWRTDTWQRVAKLDGVGNGERSLRYASFHPTKPLLITPGDPDKNIIIWQYDPDILLNKTDPDAIQYTNAKVVLVGDSGVGKSGLGMVLANERFAPTESTHGRKVWQLSTGEIELRGDERKRRAQCEVLLWDLAGQPGYRLIHQLHLDEVAVALLVFDGRSETDPFAGVMYWDRAVRQSRLLRGNNALPLKKLLVAARSDRGGPAVSKERIRELVQEYEFVEYVETSAKEGRNVSELREAIHKAIDWQRLPIISSTKLFKEIKDFLVTQKEKGRLLVTSDELYRSYQEAFPEARKEDRRAEFETCIGRVEAAGLISRLSFGKLVLLQPELLDAYASALINEVREEPDGLGYITEQSVLEGDFFIPSAERISDTVMERLLLIAMVESLLRRELALREDAWLVFPSESTRVNPDLPDVQGESVTFGFEGPVQNVYATLAVRLCNSGALFKKDQLWKNAITYKARPSGTCGLYLKHIDEGRAELTLFFDEQASGETRLHFEDYVYTHLDRHVLGRTLKRRRHYRCSCGTTMPEALIQIAQKQQRAEIKCFICGRSISLRDLDEPVGRVNNELIASMDASADERREREVKQMTIQGKEATDDFDVFLCHNGSDKAAVKEIGKQLREKGLLPWLDEWELQPGLPWQRALERQIDNIKSVAVFVGKDGMGPWQQMELEAFLRKFVRRGCPVIPVILADAPREPQLPTFLEGMTWVDFRKTEPDPLTRLIWGITGRRPDYD